MPSAHTGSCVKKFLAWPSCGARSANRKMKFLVASQVCNVAPLGNPASQRTAFSDGVGGPEGDRRDDRKILPRHARAKVRGKILGAQGRAVRGEVVWSFHRKVLSGAADAAAGGGGVVCNTFGSVSRPAVSARTRCASRGGAAANSARRSRCRVGGGVGGE